MKILKNNLNCELNLRTEMDFPIKGIEFIDINQFTLYTEIYAQISKFYIYNEVLIGGYAFNTNKHFQSSPMKGRCRLWERRLNRGRKMI